ncbi:Aliphatic sulfonates import ATP-binding protein SsuB [Achromobacter animicus]|uniref:Aliphatic sulfonates import ATP-binding protein SsuB n=1 Tax=Achromobacter animicus TaxID=1389935 RepID=A0A6S7A1B8_9BURK|nr:ATP-binding cassette domain-containing protein [Achromobacter animicus]CAB3705842.1 Aliphatic sulfonates import ATP-binding protein SsuB [Achromobacter animicus]
MFIHPNEFELFQHLQAPYRAERDNAPDEDAARPAPLRVTLRRLAGRVGGDVLHPLDLDIAAGEFVAVVGRADSGKRALLRMLAGEATPTGEQGGAPQRSPVLFDNFPLWAPDHRIRALGADARLLPWKRVIDNVALGLPERDRALAALRQVDLARHADDWPASLTGAQCQRVALARALAHRPGLLLLDEPLGRLDALARIGMQGELEAAWRRQGFTAVLATHDAAEAVAVADRILVLDAGRVTLDVRVDLPRPRVRGSAAFTALEARVLRAALGQPDTPGPDGRPLAPVIQIRHLRLAV